MTTLPPPIAERLRCPRCNLRIHETSLACASGHQVLVRDGYYDVSDEPRDATTQQTFDSFGYEWRSFDQLNPEDREFWERYMEDVPFAELSGAIALDAGCGKGRYTRFTAERVAALVALDGSTAVEAAARNLADLPNVCAFRCDLRSSPFAPGSFDLITCLGVLHHLSDPEEGFTSLVRLLAPRGVLLVYLYSRPSQRGMRSAMLGAAAWVRRLSVRLPHRLVRLVCWPLAIGLTTLFVVPGSIGARLGVLPLSRLPLQAYRGKPLRALWLDTFDRLSAPVEHRYRWEDVERWYRAAELEVLAVRECDGLMITARRAA